MKTTSRPKSIEAYIARAPREVRGKLKELRAAIRKTAPKALEKISYGMPYYGYKGRLAYFAYAKAHIGLYVPPPVIAEHKKELKDYGTSTATVRFPLDKKLPIALIKKLIRARMKKNEAKTKKL
ncbi:hypothetical protein A3A39_00450 [Candidatus Kaiserbacteria bacterium RIFCSPLOWO2_01_FULL_54_13]|uniref:YdhG-like domain-containing protein n=1 Tax=Candidatus Kaiserbacteria bacterium RIFCSPLOWO2_01_FULL_54_13 TaxID=1798512 RepID=A0A1F6F0M7_9BACT|nr:MAG: hypothetical protein A3A39_00450 [Candidatus Kaiserbacteria bacterium RIFCSPLOWO2_01_FULL_54_13]